jgi:hypothetical protein
MSAEMFQKSALTIALATALVACGGDDNKSNSSNSSNASTATRVTAFASSSSCSNGGITVETGIDENSNGVLDTNEVDNTQEVCNGVNGTDGTNGTNGTNGTDGYNSLINLVEEEAGANCTLGGYLIQTGLDTDRSGTLETSEVTSTAYVCNGIADDSGSGTGTDSALVINEVRSTGDFDYIELYNTTDSDYTVSGTDWTVLDSDDTHTPVTIPDGTVIAAHGFLVIMPDTSTPVDGAPEAILAAEGADFGLGKGDTARLFYQGNMVDSYTITDGVHANSAGRLPDGGAWSSTDLFATPGESNLAASPASLNVTTLYFDAFNDQEDALEADGFRVFGPGADLAMDVEPEYVTIAEDNSKAWVSLQENNGLAVIDLTSGSETISKILPLGTKDHSLTENALNASDKDSGDTSLSTYANLKGFYMPDGITSFTDGGTHYVLTANEGDSRDYSGFSEEGRVKDLTLDSTAFPDAATLQGDAVLGRLKTTFNPFSDESIEGTAVDTIYSFGARSFSIFNGDTGVLVADSGTVLAEQTIAAGAYDDGRSDDKGSEPESVVVGMVNGTRMAFVGMERASAIAIFDISDVTSPVFSQLLTHSGDTAPEGVLFLDASTSPSGINEAVIVANEVSGTVTLYAADASGTFAHVSTATLEGGEGAAEITAYDASNNKLYVVNNGAISNAPRVDILTIANDGSLSITGSIALGAYGAGVNSVSVKAGKLAVAMEAADKQANGTVAVFNTSDDSLYGYARVGALPDMVTFSHDGNFIMTANEGEPNSAYTRDPKGSVSVIRLN